MGIGRLEGSKFNLVLSLRYDASTAEIREWERSFQQASELLYDATDGQHQLGDIYVANDSSGGGGADFWLLEQENGRANAGGLAVIGDDNVHVTLHGEDRYRPFIVIHELIHYAYGPADEYVGSSDDPECIGDGNASACIMEWSWREGDRFGPNANGGSLVEGRVSELCAATNHDPDTDTAQHSLYNESCWETMTDEFGGLTAPSGTPTDPPPADPDTINWIELVNEERFMLVVDRSSSMSGNKLTEAKYGADWWAEQALDGEHLGVVSYADTASSPPDYPLQEISGDADRRSAQSAVSGIMSGGWTAVGDGLRTALDEIQTAGSRAATQVIVLLTDGRHNRGEDPSSVLPDLADYGVRVYTIGIGRSINSSLLQTIASRTGGQFYRIDPSLPRSDQEYRIRRRLQEIAGTARDGGGLVTAVTERLGGASEPSAPGEPPEPPDPDEPLAQREVDIERGSDLATFAISWKSHDDVLHLVAEAPSGEEYRRSVVPAGGRELQGQQPWHGYHVQDPEAGTWTLHVFADGGELPVEVTTFAFSRNTAIGGGLFGRDRIARGGTIDPRLQVYYDDPVTDLDIDGYVRRPGGPREDIEFEFDEELEGCTSGVATASFGRTHGPGFYTVSATVSATDAQAVDDGEKLTDRDEIESEAVPEFQRTFTRTVQVGEEPGIDIQLTPPTGAVGDSLQVTLTGNNTHFYRGTQVSFGSGIIVEDVDVADHEHLTASIRIDEEATPGGRTVVVSTPRYDEHVEVEAGFEVTEDDELTVPFPAPIDRMRYDLTGRLTGIQLEGSDTVVEVPDESEEFLTSVRERGDSVEIRVDEESNETAGFDIS